MNRSATPLRKLDLSSSLHLHHRLKRRTSTLVSSWRSIFWMKMGYQTDPRRPNRYHCLAFRTERPYTQQLEKFPDYTPTTQGGTTILVCWLLAGTGTVFGLRRRR